VRIHTNTRVDCPNCGGDLGYYCYSDYSVGIPGAAELTDKECVCDLTEEQYDELDTKAWNTYCDGE
jgi:hypothetical protein